MRSVVLSYATLAHPGDGFKGKEVNRSERRRAGIRALLDKQVSGGVPSSRAMAKLLLEYSGIQVSHVTVRANYAEMGLLHCRVTREAPSTLFP